MFDEFRLGITGSYEAVLAMLQSENQSIVGLAKAAGGLDDGVEDRLQLRRRTADNVKDFAGRGLILQRLTKLLRTFSEFTRSLLLRLEQPRVLDGDDCLVGKGLQESYLSI